MPRLRITVATLGLLFAFATTTHAAVTTVTGTVTGVKTCRDDPGDDVYFMFTLSTSGSTTWYSTGLLSNSWDKGMGAQVAKDIVLAAFLTGKPVTARYSTTGTICGASARRTWTGDNNVGVTLQHE